MTRDEFDCASHEPCRGCGAPVRVEHTEHNALSVRCTSATCVRRFTPWGPVINIKQNNRKTRKEYPMGQSLEEVWDRFDNLCFVCGRTEADCRTQQIGRHRHHVAEYAQVGHQGPIVPICGLCHPVVTALQKMRALAHWSGTHVESISDRGARVSPTGVSPDSVRAEGEAPVGVLERISDDDADE